MEAREGVGDAAGAVFHVDDCEVVTGQAGDLGEGRGEAEEEYAVKSLAISEAGFECFWDGGGGGGGGRRTFNAYGSGGAGAFEV